MTRYCININKFLSNHSIFYTVKRIDTQMSRQPLLDSNRSYTFSNYFELGFTVDDLFAEFGYSFERKFIDLPQYSGTLDRLGDLKQRIEEADCIDRHSTLSKQSTFIDSQKSWK
ncbi:hypothetical protein [Nostoc sp.]|uniref:hypothetical protein n=1 Tax=Nostoc sp. TaxID=1180 RepID=UPI002FF2888E